MLKIMRPIDLFEIPRPQEQFKYSLQEQFFVQFNRIIEQKLQEILKDTLGLLFQSISPLASKDTVFGALKVISSKLVDCKELITNYLKISKAIDHNYDTAAVEFLNRTIPTIVELIHKVTIHNATEQEQIEALSKTCQELSNIISEQNIELTISQADISGLFIIIDQVGRESDSNPNILEIIKTAIKHVVYHEDPVEFISSFANSSLDLMTELQVIINDKSYTNEKKIEFIKAGLAKLPELNAGAKEYILQLGCELLKLNDAQGALEVFNSPVAEEMKSTPEILFNTALALVEFGEKDNYLNAEYQLKRLIEQVVQTEAIDLNKVRMLLVATLDKQGKHDEAVGCYRQISSEYRPEEVLEKLLLLKYQFSLVSAELNRFKKGITDQVCTLINDDEISKGLFEEDLDTDILYLVGMGYASQNKLPEAIRYFKKAVDTPDINQSMLITSKSYATYHMLCVGAIMQDFELVDKLIKKIPTIDVDWVPTGYDSTPLYLAAEDLKTNIPEILLDKSANPFSINNLTELTPVHRAITSLNYKLLNKVCELVQPPPNHEAEQPMDYQLGMVDALSYSEKIRLADYLDKLGYNTEFQSELLAETNNPEPF